MDRYPYVYICGVGVGPKSELRNQNLHMPLKFEEGGTVDITSYNQFTFRAVNAALVEIPALSEGWEGKDREHTRCKNVQFAVAAFGYPPYASNA